MKTERLYFALDLKEYSKIIQEYIAHHKKVWPRIITSIKESGIVNMEIFNISNRLFMVMEVNEHFSLKAKVESDKNKELAQKWDSLIEQY